MRRRSSSSRGSQLSALQKRMRKSRQKSTRRGRGIIRSDLDINIWTPSDGNNLIDIIPYKAGKYDTEMGEGEETYVFEYAVHWNVGPGKKQFLCLAEMLEQPCPICEYRQELINNGSHKDVYKQLFPKERCMYNVVVCNDRNEKKKGVQVWEESHWYTEKILTKLAFQIDHDGNEIEIEFADKSRDRGRSLYFQVEPRKGDDPRKLTSHSFQSRSYDISDKILSQAMTLDSLIYIPTYDEIADAFWAGEVPGRSNKKHQQDDEQESSSSRRDRSGNSRRGKQEENNSNDESPIVRAEKAKTKDELKEIIRSENLDVEYSRRTSFDALQELVIKAMEDDAEVENEGYDGATGNDDLPSPENDMDLLLKELDEITSVTELKYFVEDEGIDIDIDETDDIDDIKDDIEAALEEKFEGGEKDNKADNILKAIKAVKNIRELRTFCKENNIDCRISIRDGLATSTEKAIRAFKRTLPDDDIPF